MKIKILKVRILYVIENNDIPLDIQFQHSLSCYTSSWRLGGYLQRLWYENKSVKYHFVKIIKDSNGVDLEESLAF